MSYLFYNCSSLTTLSIKFSNELTINMKSVFENCISLISLDLSNFYTKKDTYISWMFNYCTSLKFLNIVNFYTMQDNMLDGCNSLTSLIAPDSNTQNFLFYRFIELKYILIFMLL